MQNFKVALIYADESYVPDWVAESLEKEGIDLIAHNCTTREELAQYEGDADVVWTFGARCQSDSGGAVRCPGTSRNPPNCGTTNQVEALFQMRPFIS